MLAMSAGVVICLACEEKGLILGTLCFALMHTHTYTNTHSWGSAHSHAYRKWQHFVYLQRDSCVWMHCLLVRLCVSPYSGVSRFKTLCAVCMCGSAPLHPPSVAAHLLTAVVKVKVLQTKRQIRADLQQLLTKWASVGWGKRCIESRYTINWVA